MPSFRIIIKRVWTDQVGSKIIAAAIVAVAASMWVSYRAGFFKAYLVPVWVILLFVTATISLSLTLHLRKRNPAKLNNSDGILKIEKAGTLASELLTKQPGPNG